MPNILVEERIYGRARSIIKNIAFIGNYQPRQCGITTFTTDLCETLAAQFCEIKCIALAVNDTKQGYTYPARVCFELDEKDVESYRHAADFLNSNNGDVACLQFDHGIFGGSAGNYILSFLRELHMPIVTTLHTILDKGIKYGVGLVGPVCGSQNGILRMALKK